MRKIFTLVIALACLASLSLTSCKKDSSVVILGVRGESGANNKGYLDANRYLKWYDGEQVRVNNQTSSFAVGTNTVTIAAEESDTYTAFYPASAISSTTNLTSATSVNFEIPTIQTYTLNGTDQEINMPMVARTRANTTPTPTTLHFKNCGSIIEVTIANNYSSAIEVSSIEISSQDKMLSGVFNATIPDDDNDTTEVSTFNENLNSNSVTLNFPTAQSISTGSTKTYRLLVAYFTNARLAIKVVTSTTNYFFSITPTANRSLARNNIAKVTLNCSNTNYINPRYSVSASKQVIFAKGNLQCYYDLNSQMHYRFAKYQWESYKSNQPSLGTLSFSQPKDLFVWGSGDSPLSYEIIDDDDKVDWAKCGSSITKDFGTGWATLVGGNNQNEWYYVTHSRTDASSKTTVARLTINGVNYDGIVIVPDDWSTVHDFGGTSAIISRNSGYIYTADEWFTMETKGATFLPTTGCLDATGTYSSDASGFYWSLTEVSGNTDNAYYTQISPSRYSSYMNCSASNSKSTARAVRLTKDVTNN